MCPHYGKLLTAAWADRRALPVVDLHGTHMASKQGLGKLCLNSNDILHLALVGPVTASMLAPGCASALDELRHDALCRLQVSQRPLPQLLLTRQRPHRHYSVQRGIRPTGTITTTSAVQRQHSQMQRRNALQAPPTAYNRAAAMLY